MYASRFGEFRRAEHRIRVPCCVVWFPVYRTRVVVDCLGDVDQLIRKGTISVLYEVLES